MKVFILVTLIVFQSIQWISCIPDLDESLNHCKSDFPDLAPWTYNITTFDKGDRENVPGIKCLAACMAKLTFPGNINEENGVFMIEKFTALKPETPDYEKVKTCLEFRGSDNCETTYMHFKCAGSTIFSAIIKKALEAIVSRH